jgi:DNA (cytosine-5)-methyltransferase 1
MGLPDEYSLPLNYNLAYHLAGDGVVVPVVRFLAESILTPMIDSVGVYGKNLVAAE